MTMDVWTSATVVQTLRITVESLIAKLAIGVHGPNVMLLAESALQPELARLSGRNQTEACSVPIWKKRKRARLHNAQKDA